MRMDLENITLSEISQRKKILWYHLYVESLKKYKWMYMQNRNKFIDTENKLVVTKEEREEGKDKLGV